MNDDQSTLALGPTTKRHRSNQGYGTPWEFIRACEAHFNRRVEFDLAANEANAKARDYFSEEDGSLDQDWTGLVSPAGVCWLNPPFGNVAPWAEKCALEAARGVPILLLTPASVGANWFRDHIHGKAGVHALNGRIQFVGASDPYPKDCILSAYNLGHPGFHVWTWPDSVPAQP